MTFHSRYSEYTDSTAYRFSIIWSKEGDKVQFSSAGVPYMNFVLQLEDEKPSDFPLYFTLFGSEETLYLQAQDDIQNLCRDLTWD